MLIDASDHRSEGLDQVGAADDADELAVFDNRHALDPLALEEGGNLRQRGFFVDGNYASRHDLADSLAVRLREFLGERAGPGQRLQPPGPMLFSADFGAMD